MSQDTLRKLLIALVVVGALWGIASLVSGPGAPPAASAGLVDFFQAVGSGSSIRAIRLSSPGGDTVELTPTDGGWSVNGLPTDSGTVARFLTALSEATVGDLIARNVANHGRMGVVEGEAPSLAMETDGYTGSVLVGSGGPRYGTSYARLPGEDEVYLLEGDLQSHVRRSLDGWRSKRVTAVDTTSVARVEVRRDDDEYAVVRGDSTWAFEDGAEADGNTVRSILTELRDLQASGFLQEGDSLMAAPSSAHVRALSADGGTLAVLELGGGEGDRWIRAEGNPVTYRMPSYRVDRIAPPLDRVRRSG
jgi:hypothetical protein